MDSSTKRRQLACLLIHGYGGSPLELEGVATALQKAGMHVHSTHLPGHDEGDTTFSACRFSQWLAHVEGELRSLHNEYEQVMLFGFSLGGQLALNLASRFPVAGVMVVSAPVYVLSFFPWPLQHLRLYGRALRASFRGLLSRYLPEIFTLPTPVQEQELGAWKGHGIPLNIPQQYSLREGCAQTRRLLANITAPICIMQDVRDQMVPCGNAWTIARRVRSQDTTVILTRIQEPQSRCHMLPAHRETAEYVASVAVRFCREKIRAVAASDSRKQYAIRPVQEADFPAIQTVVSGAFATVAASDGDEAGFVTSMRSHPGYRPALELVARTGDTIIGHVLMTETRVDGPEGGSPVLLLAPLSVAPEQHGTGVGSALLHAAFTAARAEGYDAIFLAGNPRYYSRFEFVPTVEFGIAHTMPVPDKYIMAKELVPGSLKKRKGTIILTGHTTCATAIPPEDRQG